MEPRDDFDAPPLCGQRGLSLQAKPYFPPQVMTQMMTSDLGPCSVGGSYSVSVDGKPSPVPASSSPSTSPELHDLSPPPFSKLPPGALQAHHPMSHVSIIRETPGRYPPPGFYPPSSSSSSSSPPTSQPSTPTDGPFSPAVCVTPVQTGSGDASPGAQQPPKVAPRGRGSLQEDGSPPALAVSIKQEPQELDQMYLDDGE